MLPGAVPAGSTIELRDAVGLKAFTGEAMLLDGPCILGLDTKGLSCSRIQELLEVLVLPHRSAVVTKSVGFDHQGDYRILTSTFFTVNISCHINRIRILDHSCQQTSFTHRPGLYPTQGGTLTYYNMIKAM